MDRRNVFPSIIVFLHLCGFFLITDAFVFVICLELLTWPLAQIFAGPYWKHIIFIPFLLFLCCLPVIILVEAFRITLPVYNLVTLFFPLAALAILCLCATKYPQEGSAPKWTAYLLLFIASLAWLFLLSLAGIEIHLEIFHRGL